MENQDWAAGPPGRGAVTAVDRGPPGRWAVAGLLLAKPLHTQGLTLTKCFSYVQLLSTCSFLQLKRGEREQTLTRKFNVHCQLSGYISDILKSNIVQLGVLFIVL